MYEVVFSKRFERDLKRIIKRDPRLKNKIRKQIETLLTNPTHTSLRFHKLSGSNNWSASVTRDIRIIFTIDGKTVFCTRVGIHNEVY